MIEQINYIFIAFHHYRWKVNTHNKSHYTFLYASNNTSSKTPFLLATTFEFLRCK